ncbi:hypothetical protein KGP17_27480 (plasmid) [Serratia sp. JSRIV001]|uniref:conjugation system SOS inhibitor PsiB family protein n=1 Tax=unclassified Serratia (in: enterobacteria) TaxID=2647522 RepID=UPI001CC07E78|nr:MULTISPECIES: conjugation system SOS inhibitor PsiB family protein [unclassified Serratia (in: enterobacteria)]UAN48857.1 hypothetical protein KGP17_27480 [Serratia sp. JSRIV001]UAN54487.1 hypothetical protein KGP26_28905 [Serratia sp. JSRIV002]UAN60496.1 hypothetical protein KGP21_29155 [Serratia sp. JSRIV004]
MTKEEKFTLAKLQAFTATDFEQYRERGEEARLRLSSAVIAALGLPDCWQIDCEHRQEWCGVQAWSKRFTNVLCQSFEYGQPLWAIVGEMHGELENRTEIEQWLDELMLPNKLEDRR